MRGRQNGMGLDVKSDMACGPFLALLDVKDLF